MHSRLFGVGYLFPLCACCEEVLSTPVCREATLLGLLSRITFCVFLLQAPMRHIFLNHINASAGLHHSELVYLRVFFFLVHTFINDFTNIFIREDQGEVIRPYIRGIKTI